MSSAEIQNQIRQAAHRAETAPVSEAITVHRSHNLPEIRLAVERISSILTSFGDGIVDIQRPADEAYDRAREIRPQLEHATSGSDNMDALELVGSAWGFEESSAAATEKIAKLDERMDEVAKIVGALVREINEMLPAYQRALEDLMNAQRHQQSIVDSAEAYIDHSL